MAAAFHTPIVKGCMLSDYVEMSLIKRDRRHPHWFDCIRWGWIDELRRKGLTEEEADEMLREEID